MTTADGDIEVTYRLYEGITYVSQPVDTTYQSMNVEVPVSINGAEIDASNAPILLNITVGGYMSAAVGGSTVGGSSGGGMPGGGQPGGDASTSSGTLPDAAASGGAASGGTGSAPSGQVPTGTMPSGGPSGTNGDGGPPSGTMPTGAPGGSGDSATGDSQGGPPSGNGGQGGFAGQSGAGNSDLALAAGYVVVTPGVRGRDNQAEDGTYYGKAPAAIVDLKAAVRYIRYNQGVLPGNSEQIISTGTSAGGALSTLLGASGDSDLYDEELAAIGAADATDAIFAVAAYCPITDLDNADMAYEWVFSAQNTNAETKELSAQLAAAFPEYVNSLNLTTDGTAVTADSLGDYLLTTLLQPAATTYLKGLSDTERDTYLKDNGWITWNNDTATFTLADFAAHVGRAKSTPAFDAVDLSAAENILFGDTTTNARHFTESSLRADTGDATASIDADLQQIINMMNPMYFLTGQDTSTSATHWFLRTGTSDSDTSPTVLANLALAAASTGSDVDALMYWDAGHGANEDSAAFVAWIGKLTGYTAS